MGKVDRLNHYSSVVIRDYCTVAVSGESELRAADRPLTYYFYAWVHCLYTTLQLDNIGLTSRRVGCKNRNASTARAMLVLS